MNHRFYKKPLRPKYMTELARGHRKKPTPGEKALWDGLRKANFFGYRFRRQAPFGRYILDFYCAKMKLAIEVDGDSHMGKEEYDDIRNDFRTSWNQQVLHFREEYVINFLQDVLLEIKNSLKDRSKNLDTSTPHPPPPLTGEGASRKREGRSGGNATKEIS